LARNGILCRAPNLRFWRMTEATPVDRQHGMILPVYSAPEKPFSIKGLLDVQNP
jgi:hypothetical protein